MEAIEYYDTVEGSQSVFDYAQGTDVAILPILTTDDIDNLEAVIESCSGMNSPDAEINKILIEEMPAYFWGKKIFVRLLRSFKTEHRRCWMREGREETVCSLVLHD